MPIEPIPTETVCQVPKKDQRQVLQEHFKLLYIILSENQLIPNAAFEEVKGDVQRCLSGIAVPYHNAVMGCPEDDSWDECIYEQLRYFNEAKMPFVWFLDEDSSTEFKQKLSVADWAIKLDGVLMYFSLRQLIKHYVSRLNLSGIFWFLRLHISRKSCYINSRSADLINYMNLRGFLSLGNFWQSSGYREIMKSRMTEKQT